MTELLTLAEALPQTAGTQAELDTMCEALGESIAEQKIINSRPGLAEARALIKSTNAETMPWRKFEEVLRGRLSAAKRTWMMLVEQAINGGYAVPPVPELPSHVSFRRVKRWRLVGELDESYTKQVPDEDKIKAAVEEGRDVPGVETFDDYIVVYQG